MSHARASSPNYFGLIVESDGGDTHDLNQGGHIKQNWRSPSSIQSRAACSPQILPNDANPDFESFRRQSETNAFELGQGKFANFVDRKEGEHPSSKKAWIPGTTSSGQASPRSRVRDQKLDRRESHQDAMDVDGEVGRSSENDASETDSGSITGATRFESPANVPDEVRPPTATKFELSNVDPRYPRLSLPHQRVNELAQNTKAVSLNRASTLPERFESDLPQMISPSEFVDLLNSTGFERILLLDLRVSPQFGKSRIKGALNLCIPTTLLKRPSFNVKKLAETFTNENEKERFSRWKTVDFIVVYDANSSQVKDAISSVNTIKKFTNEGWRGMAYIVRGGFQGVFKKSPDLIEKQQGSEIGLANKGNLSIDSGAGSVQVAGGCPMPATRSAANPFFGTIRQNMDLIGGVGQMSIKHPEALTHKNYETLPTWLRRAAKEEDNGKLVSDRFLKIEQAEQQRMQSALSAQVSYGSPSSPRSSSTQVSGIEKGAKNRYKDILPFDHSRVRLQKVSPGDCDYINASYVKADWSNRQYIATQAPVPATFDVKALVLILLGTVS